MKASINDIECIVYYEERVPSEQAPLGYPYMYHLRHDEDDWSQPINLEKVVFVNFFGTVFMKEPIEIDDSGYVEIESFSMEKQFVQFKLRSAIFENIFGLHLQPRNL